jgi:hypothetical protein
MFIVPVAQSAVPDTLCATVKVMQWLVGVLFELGTGTGGPKRQPAVVQVLLLPVWAGVRPPSVKLLVEHAVTSATDVT